jgi:catechol 2,3-dioxygenase-like lactoylglutathione lyase family enzyme
MVRDCDHLTIVVRDPESAMRFFAVLGFEPAADGVIKGPVFEACMGAAGFHARNEIMDFHARKLVFIDGPEGVTVELAQWT